jgi:hypothetical protein
LRGSAKGKVGPKGGRKYEKSSREDQAEFTAQEESYGISGCLYSSAPWRQRRSKPFHDKAPFGVRT